MHKVRDVLRTFTVDSSRRRGIIECPFAKHVSRVCSIDEFVCADSKHRHLLNASAASIT